MDLTIGQNMLAALQQGMSKLGSVWEQLNVINGTHLLESDGPLPRWRYSRPALALPVHTADRQSAQRELAPLLEQRHGLLRAAGRAAGELVSPARLEADARERKHFYK